MKLIDGRATAENVYAHLRGEIATLAAWAEPAPLPQSATETLSGLDQVRGGAARHEHAARGGRQPGEIAQESECLVLRVHRARSLLPRNARQRRRRNGH